MRSLKINSAGCRKHGRFNKPFVQLQKGQEIFAQKKMHSNKNGEENEGRLLNIKMIRAAFLNLVIYKDVKVTHSNCELWEMYQPIQIVSAQIKSVLTVLFAFSILCRLLLPHAFLVSFSLHIIFYQNPLQELGFYIFDRLLSLKFLVIKTHEKQAPIQIVCLLLYLSQLGCCWE